MRGGYVVSPAGRRKDGNRLMNSLAARRVRHTELVCTSPAVFRMS